MIDLKAIKERRAAIGDTDWSIAKTSYPFAGYRLYLNNDDTIFFSVEGSGGITMFIAHAPTDIDALVAEVERLDRALELCEVGLTPSDVDEAPDDLQPCGHPRSAIVTGGDFGGPGTSYCDECSDEAEAEARWED